MIWYHLIWYDMMCIHIYVVFRNQGGSVEFKEYLWIISFCRCTTNKKFQICTQWCFFYNKLISENSGLKTVLVFFVKIDVHLFYDEWRDELETCWLHKLKSIRCCVYWSHWISAVSRQKADFHVNFHWTGMAWTGQWLVTGDWLNQQNQETRQWLGIGSRVTRV